MDQKRRIKNYTETKKQAFQCQSELNISAVRMQTETVARWLGHVA